MSGDTLCLVQSNYVRNLVTSVHLNKDFDSKHRSFKLRHDLLIFSSGHLEINFGSVCFRRPKKTQHARKICLTSREQLISFCCLLGLEHSLADHVEV